MTKWIVYHGIVKLWLHEISGYCGGFKSRCTCVLLVTVYENEAHLKGSIWSLSHMERKSPGDGCIVLQNFTRTLWSKSSQNLTPKLCVFMCTYINVCSNRNKNTRQERIPVNALFSAMTLSFDYYYCYV